MKYNLSKIMLKAWKVYRSGKQISFGEALHRAWLSAKAEEINITRIETAKKAANVTSLLIHGLGGKNSDLRLFTEASHCLAQC